MGLRETEESTADILERMENTLNNLEQMSFDSINITDRLVTLISNARELVLVMNEGNIEERDNAFKEMSKILDKLLDTAFIVNNVSHELENETVYQRESVENIRQIVDFLYDMNDSELL
ncbi:MAG: hypothetical protein MR384_10025 [Lachnospiraceae bacterium]|nr:hypothetical protein [Lachnospiraceae bacterium]MCI5588202.1 hypothetical protein [Lachnospiraceae bacterium]